MFLEKNVGKREKILVLASSSVSLTFPMVFAGRKKQLKALWKKTPKIADRSY